jgi:hypothetical protein
LFDTQEIQIFYPNTDDVFLEIEPEKDCEVMTNGIILFVEPDACLYPKGMKQGVNPDNIRFMNTKSARNLGHYSV